MRPFATLFISLVMALGAIGLAVAAPGGADRELADVRLQAASGAATIGNSRDGQAVLNAAAMRPGQTVSGTVTIGNDGDVAGQFAVRGSGVHDIPGPNGGLLSQRVRLVVLDVTDHPVTVYTGAPADFDQVSLGTFAPGEEREYRFTAELHAATDNSFQGASLSLGFQWSASSAAPPVDTGTGGVPPAPAPTPAPTAPTASLADILGLPAANTCVKKGKLKVRLKAPKGTKLVSATVKVNKRIKARLKGKKLRKPVQLRGLGAKPVKITVTVKASNRRTYTATRTYAGCR